MPLPTYNEIGQLPARCAVGYVARILKRLAPQFYHIQDTNTRHAVERVTEAAEAFCRGDLEPKDAARLAALPLFQHQINTVAQMAGAVARGIQKNDSNAVAYGAAGLASNLITMKNELRRDFDSLTKWCRYQSESTPLDVSDDGPLGSLWVTDHLLIPVSVWEDQFSLLGRRRRIFSLASRAARTSNAPEALIQATITTFGDKTAEGQLIISVADLWFEIMQDVERDPDFLFHFVKHPRKFEEFIAATYHKAGWPSVELTPRSGDKGRDVIVTRPGFGSIRFVDQCKAYGPGHRVTAEEVRALAFVMMRDLNVSKGLVTTTSEFAPGIFKGDEFKELMPHRLELKDGPQLREWLRGIALGDQNPITPP